MMTWSMQRRSFLIVGFLLVVLTGASRVSQTSTGHASQVHVDVRDDYDAEVVSLLRMTNPHEPEAYGKALELIASLRAVPSCARYATATLLRSCQDVEGAKDNGRGPESSETTLDQVKSVYAARLAVCELIEAGATVPAQCASLTPPPKPSNLQRGYTTFFQWNKRVAETGDGGMVGIDSEGLIHCLKSLESRPQWWTSYSNSRQNAAVMCSAVRGQIERDHILQVYDSMTQVTSNLNQALSKAVNRSASHLNHQRTYAEALQSVQKDLHENLVKTGMAAAKTISRLVDEFELSAARMLNKIASAGETADAQYAGLAHKLRSTHDGVDAYQERVGKVFQEVIRGSSELAARQTSEWEANHRLAADVAAMLRRMNEQEIHKAVMGLKGVVTQMERSTSALASVQSQQKAIDERFVKINGGFDHLEDRVQLVRSSQEEQIAAQAQMNELSERERRLVLQFYEKSSTSAIRLQLAVEDATAKINSLGSFGALDALLAKVGKWAMLGFALVSLGWVSKRTAVWIVLGASLFTVLSANLPTLFRTFAIGSWLGSTAKSALSPAGSDQQFRPELSIVLRGCLAGIGTVLVLGSLGFAARAAYHYHLGRRSQALVSQEMVHRTLPKPDLAWTPERQIQSCVQYL